MKGNSQGLTELNDSILPKIFDRLEGVEKDSHDLYRSVQRFSDKLNIMDARLERIDRNMSALFKS